MFIGVLIVVLLIAVVITLITVLTINADFKGSLSDITHTIHSCNASFLPEDCHNVYDGSLSVGPGREWSVLLSRGESHPWIQLMLDVDRIVQEVHILPKCNKEQQIARITMGFGSRSTEAIQADLDCVHDDDYTSCDSITWQTVTLNPVRTSVILIHITQNCYPDAINTGMRELKLFGAL